MKWQYRLVFDSGEIVHIVAESRSKAIEAYCSEHGADRSWANKHCKVVNLGREN